ncbi:MULTISPECIES: tRNA pseudouridine(38-40) synthase TruA [unclassified Niallia]|uniref:tRNA pseudouridine(38-40) synthase TruA n=1 Tax=unclassified Niallia TaxID=2837522 RepID=UPI001EDA9887|nr:MULTISPECIES: tRNA pseudouridine(38-40) synthase TruA [unclassified Niallia]MDL0437167.1 tRNA pseudouridine(38-40) synthase TruA [Niallia sp. SS-2023]UPO87815.1 tRNA pseudouridine(38-40) synthase TruA [Niallia sp. Man26]
MQRYKGIVSYDGTEYCGFQLQPKDRTVQGEIEKALKKLHKGSEIKIQASGRTDAGVHAKGQVIHFDSDLDIPAGKWELALNALLPHDIVFSTIEAVDRSFHARYDVQGKEYRYFIHLSERRDPFKRNFSYYYPYQLDIGAIREALEYFIGEHDFTSFCSMKTDKEDKVRTIHSMRLVEEGDILVFCFEGNGFLYNMVRIIIGTLLDVGRGKRKPESIKEIIEKKDRKAAGKTASANGLYLWKVFY